MFSFGLQNSIHIGDGGLDQIAFTSHCYELASKIIKITREELTPPSFFKYATDQQIIIFAYSACFLLKVRYLLL
jgi:hypothetical protein